MRVCAGITRVNLQQLSAICNMVNNHFKLTTASPEPYHQLLYCYQHYLPILSTVHHKDNDERLLNNLKLKKYQINIPSLGWQY